MAAIMIATIENKREKRTTIVGFTLILKFYIAGPRIIVVGIRICTDASVSSSCNQVN